MSDQQRSKSLITVVIATALGAFVAWAGSDGGERIGSVPVFALCGALAFGINWLAFIPAAIAKTEHYYDLVGGISYIGATIAAVVFSSELDLRAMLVAAMVLVWSIRLATFLFKRIAKAGKDSRFDEIKLQPMRFLMAWTLQGLWVLLTAAAAFAVITGGTRVPLGVVGFIGIAIWLFGITIEIVADRQKSAFKSDPANKGKFIDVGLWAWSRHPNYFGEITLWVGMAIIALPVLHGWQWVTLISPVFVAILLTKGSGVPLLEKQADERWGGQTDYEEYKRKTPVLLLKPPA
ncbi:MAG: DUF1295 domain-containing protein [Gammaproteobacteria bacterium]